MRRTTVLAALCTLLLIAAPAAFALDADDLGDLLGYTIIAFTHVDGDFEGAEYGKVVQLENRMVFEFHEYNYSYSYRPSVAVFAQHVSSADMLSAGIKNPPSAGTTLYKLIIDDEVYDVGRMR
ncbi:MAG: hypothetical protein A2W00_01760 [Candidatus Eisenbacteria bacterium RBG_16_71_46]|nr:MAG: hypothetical protein A2W00_01760 [Candidatus Eisenbacteria bacterium RBG_16_71_46]